MSPCPMQIGAKVMLGDRPVRVTLARCWASLSRWSRMRFIFSLLWGGLTMGGEDLKAQVEDMKVGHPAQDMLSFWIILPEVTSSS